MANKDNLEIIKEGKTGHGLLIETDGYVSLPKNNKLTEGIEDGEWHCPRHFIVDCILQKAGIQNANGRIYPRDILEREVEKYQQRIAEHRALGECYTPDVMVLCEYGWKNISDVTEKDNVLSLNTETNEIEIKKVVRKIEYDYSGDMIRIKNKSFNDLVTPNHKFPLYNRYHSFRGFETADDIYNEKVVDLTHSYIPKRGIWKGKYIENFILPKISDSQYNSFTQEYLKEKYKSELVIPIDSFCKFMGIYLSEGHYSKNANNVFISQKKKEICQDIEDMLDEWGIHYTIETKDTDTKIYCIADIRLHEYVKKFGNCYTKYVPQEIKDLPAEQLREFYDWFVKGDGRGRAYYKEAFATDDVFSACKQLVLDLNEIQLKIGYNGTYHLENRQHDRYIQGRLIEGKNCHNMHFTRRGLSRGSYFDKRHTTVTKELYTGKVMCIEVEDNHNFFVMSNGFTHWTGNCDHPSDSTISLQRISHNIIEMHWENNTVVGKLELNLSEGFRRMGIVSTMGDQVANLLLNGYKIGISSRAIGSVESKLGKMIVGEDLELLGWDIVSDPSTPQAFLGHYEDLQQFIESDNSKAKKTIISEKIDKIKCLLG